MSESNFDIEREVAEVIIQKSVDEAIERQKDVPEAEIHNDLIIKLENKVGDMIEVASKNPRDWTLTDSLLIRSVLLGMASLLLEEGRIARDL